MGWTRRKREGCWRNGASVGGHFDGAIILVATRRVRVVNGRRELQLTAGIDDLGDLRTLGGLREIDATGMTAVPDADYTEGQLIDLPDWRLQGDRTIAVGQPARIALLTPAGPAAAGKYRVEVVLR